MEHLWEVKHDYYCNESNYYSNDCHASYESWADFVEEEGDADMDLNLLFRWDWHCPQSEPDAEPNHTLQLFFVGQRKGLFRCAEIKVTPDSETDVRQWLFKRYRHLMKLWEPLSKFSIKEELREELKSYENERSRNADKFSREGY